MQWREGRRGAGAAQGKPHCWASIRQAEAEIRQTSFSPRKWVLKVGFQAAASITWHLLEMSGAWAQPDLLSELWGGAQHRHFNKRATDTHATQVWESPPWKEMPPEEQRGEHARISLRNAMPPK